MSDCTDITRKFKEKYIKDRLQEKKDIADMVTRIGAGIILVFLFGAMIVGGAVGYKHLPEDYKIPAIVFISVTFFPVVIALLAAPFLYWAKVNKDKQQKEPLSNVNESKSYSPNFSVKKT